jgi:hypothetical protein
VEDYPVYPAPCPGCRYLTELPESYSKRMRECYVGCRYFLDTPMPHFAGHERATFRKMSLIPKKFIEGPHEGDMLTCDTRLEKGGQ